MLANRRRRLGERLLAERRRVGAVIGDVAVLEQPLRRLHRALGREPELAARFLRQRRRRERRRGPLDAGLLVDAVTVHGRCCQSASTSAAAVGLRQHAHVLAGQHAVRVEVLAGRDALVADARERRRELAPVAGEPRLEIPVASPRGTRGALLRDRRSAARRRSARGRRSGRSAPSSTAPATACSRTADRECGGFPARGPGSRRRRARRCTASLIAFFGDLVEDDPLDRHLRLEDLLQVPADRLALAIGVGREHTPAMRPSAPPSAPARTSACRSG